MKLITLLLFVGLAACSSDDPPALANNENNQNNETNNEQNNKKDAGSDALSQADVQSNDTSADLSDDANADAGTDTQMTDAATDAALDGGEDAGDPRTPRGSCESDIDCRAGNCVDVGDDPNTAWRTCAVRYQEQDVCLNGNGDECCKSDECTDGDNGVCLQPVPTCSGVRPQPFNRCYYDGCSSDADCTAQPNGMCLPAGAFREPTTTCTYGDCRTDAECGTGGSCIPFTDPCVNRLTGFFCVNADSECQTDEDCKNAPVQGIPYCAPGPNGPTCQGFFPPA